METICDTCNWWAWDCMDPDGNCMNKSKKKCEPGKRQLWEPRKPEVKKTCANCKRHYNLMDSEICNERDICKRFPLRRKLVDRWEPK